MVFDFFFFFCLIGKECNTRNRKILPRKAHRRSPPVLEWSPWSSHRDFQARPDQESGHRLAAMPDVWNETELVLAVEWLTAEHLYAQSRPSWDIFFKLVNEQQPIQNNQIWRKKWKNSSLITYFFKMACSLHYVNKKMWGEKGREQKCKLCSSWIWIMKMILPHFLKNLMAISMYEKNVREFYGKEKWEQKW